MEIRQAKASDAEEACNVIRQSIETLCAADHRGDPDLLREWLSNKAPATIAQLIEAPSNYVVVAIEPGGGIAGVGAAHLSGEMTLNYVAPASRFRGVSKAILRAIEDHLRERGQSRCRLTSTRTAHAFYTAAGYLDDGPSSLWRGMPGQPMVKPL